MPALTLFEPRIEVMRVPLRDTKYQLSYESSEMGVWFDRVPSPLVYTRNTGLWLVEPGPSSVPDPTLLAFREAGGRTIRNPLSGLVGATDPGQLKVHYLLPGVSDILLICSRAVLGASEPADFVGVELDYAGNARRVFPLVGFESVETVYRGADKTLYALTISPKHPPYWQTYDSGGAYTSSDKCTQGGCPSIRWQAVVDFTGRHRRTARCTRTNEASKSHRHAHGRKTDSRFWLIRRINFNQAR